MATPHVAGAAALVWGNRKYKSMNAQQIKNVLMQNVSKQSGLTSRCVSGGILDLAFLGGAPDDTDPPPPPVTGSGMLASGKFIEPKEIIDGDNVLKVRIKLTEECDVLIRADSSITSAANVKNVSTGFLDAENVENRWQGSARRMSVKASRWTPVVASYVVRLGRGSHDLYWKVWDDDASGNTLTLNAGTMTVEAIPVRSK